MKTRAMKPGAKPSSQAGSVLMMSVIMLMGLTLLALSAIKMGTLNLRSVNNMQARAEAVAAADSAINTVLSQSLLDGNKPMVLAPMMVGGQQVSFDNPFLATGVTPRNHACVRSVTPISNSDLPVVFPTWVAECQSGKPFDERASFCSCLSATGETGFNKKKGNAISECNRVNWDVVASASTGVFGARVQLVRGVETIVRDQDWRFSLNKTENVCSGSQL